MRLTPSERDRLLLFTAAELARARLARGLRLNVPEATALIADTVCEAARDGARLAQANAAGRAALTAADVLPGVADVLTEIAVEAVFDDGTRLVIINEPIRDGTPGDDAPGATLTGDAPQQDQAATATVIVINTAAVPISVTSHLHFFEVNRRLSFDRAAAYGLRAAIPSGSSIRFSPGQMIEVPLTPILGARVAIGFAGLVDGPLDAPGAREEALRRAHAWGYLDSGLGGNAEIGHEGRAG